MDVEENANDKDLQKSENTSKFLSFKFLISNFSANDNVVKKNFMEMMFFNKEEKLENPRSLKKHIV